MTRAGVGALVAIALTAGLALRLVRLDARPMHHDEANQAIKFGTLLERGEYHYDTHDHHGPTLYYLTLPAAWLRGQATLASLDERTLRGVPAVFGAATILLLPLVSAGIGRTAVATSAWLLALSPAMVFYSRMFIQESLFACFTLAFVIAVGRVALGGGPAWWTLSGVAAGLAVATKETSAIVLPAALVACAIAWWSLGPDRPDAALAGGRWRRAAIVSLAAAAAIASLFYSSFLANPGGILEPFRAAGTYLDRGIDPPDHAHPWHYYVGLLTYSSSGGLRWSEGLVLVLAIIGALSAWALPRAPSKGLRPEPAFWARYLTCNVAITAGIFSALPYKTPWNLLPFYVGAIVLAGIGFSTLIRRDRVPRGSWRAGGSARDRVRPARMAGVARVGDLRVGPAQSLRLRAHRPRRRPHGDAHPPAGRRASRRDAHAGVGHRTAARAVAASVVSPDDAPRRLLDRAGRRPGPAGAGRRRLDGPHRRSRQRPWRSLRVGVLRPQARGAPDALRRAWAVGALPGPGGPAGWRPRAETPRLPTTWHCEPTPTVALWRSSSVR